MNRNLFGLSFVLGALAVLWVALGFFGSHHLALTMTVLIAVVYALGALELRQFRQATAQLASALDALSAEITNLDAWLDSIPPVLRNQVRLRVQGERVGLPGPALTPYLIGLLVMLGMLGTFLGMVVTLNGAAFSMQGSTDLQTIRTALVEPIKGLGLAFGTSVAGVAASAMLGLMSSLSRRDRLQVAQHLDTRIAAVLFKFSLNHQRQQAYQAIQSQASALPAVVDQLQALALKMEQMGQQLSAQLLGNQDRFHQQTQDSYRALATSVEQSLKTSLSGSAQAAGEAIKPVLADAMSAIAQDARRQHERVADVVQTQLDGLTDRLAQAVDTVHAGWTAALTSHERSSHEVLRAVDGSLAGMTQGLEQHSAALLSAMGQAQATWLAQQSQAQAHNQSAWEQSLQAMAGALRHEWQSAGAQTLAQQNRICATLADTAQAVTAQTQASAKDTLAEIARLVQGGQDLIEARRQADADVAVQHRLQMQELSHALRTELSALKEEEARRGAAAIAQMSALQDAVTRHLTTLGTALEEPITRLLQTASEAPRAAAEVLVQLRQELSSSLARDNALLQERGHIMDTVKTLLDTIKHAAVEQRGAIDALVSSSMQVLTQAGTRLSEQVDAESARLTDLSAQLESGALAVSGLGESMGVAVQSFSQANSVLIDNLQRIESALDKSMNRSDEQLAYYVAQAREIVDLTLLSQKNIFDEVGRGSASKTRPAQAAQEVA